MNNAPRRALLIAAPGFVLSSGSRSVSSSMLHGWLDSWSGLGAIVVGLSEHSYELTLIHDKNGWGGRRYPSRRNPILGRDLPIQHRKCARTRSVGQAPALHGFAGFAWAPLGSATPLLPRAMGDANELSANGDVQVVAAGRHRIVGGNRSRMGRGYAA